MIFNTSPSKCALVNILAVMRVLLVDLVATVADAFVGAVVVFTFVVALVTSGGAFVLLFAAFHANKTGLTLTTILRVWKNFLKVACKKMIKNFEILREIKGK